jgi:hypothetical protein
MLPGSHDARARERTRSIVVSTYMRAVRSAATAPHAFDAALAEYRKRHPYVPESSARHTVAEILSRADDPDIIG